MKEKLHAPKEFTCEYCGKKYISVGSKSKYCCNAHKTFARNESGVDKIEATCVICGKTFKKNKYAKTKTCGRECGIKLKSANRMRSKYEQ